MEYNTIQYRKCALHGYLPTQHGSRRAPWERVGIWRNGHCGVTLRKLQHSALCVLTAQSLSSRLRAPIPHMKWLRPSEDGFCRGVLCSARGLDTLWIVILPLASPFIKHTYKTKYTDTNSHLHGDWPDAESLETSSPMENCAWDLQI